jgi:carbohydrate-selective porin OprB
MLFRTLCTCLLLAAAAQAAAQDTAPPGYAANFIYTNDLLTNLRGGTKRGTIDQGKLEAILAADLEKLAGLEKLSFFANGFLIHNTGRMRRDYVGGVNMIAAIEAVPAARLSELWLEQGFAGGRASLRSGQKSRRGGPRPRGSREAHRRPRRSRLDLRVRRSGGASAMRPATSAAARRRRAR